MCVCVPVNVCSQTAFFLQNATSISVLPKTYLTVTQQYNKQSQILKGEVHDFYKTSWFVVFEALSRMVKVRGSCDKPFKMYSRLKNLLL